MPLCADCFDSEGLALWNALAAAPWRRTITSLRRPLAADAGIPRRLLSRRVRVSYVKVAEYQRRGAIHYHAILRLDPHDPQAGERFTTDQLTAAIRHAAAHAALARLPGRRGQPGPALARPVRWGDQLDLREISDDHDRDAAGLRAGQVAGYLAKYATKATDTIAPGLDRRLTTADRDRLDLPAHLAALVDACWQLATRPDLRGLGLRRWAHQLGYRGHTLTKSRHYSATFRALRAARRAWATRRRHGPHTPLDPDGRPLPPDGTLAIGTWQYAGRGYTTPGDAWLAHTLAHQAQEVRRLAREEVTAVA